VVVRQTREHELPNRGSRVEDRGSGNGSGHRLPLHGGGSPNLRLRQGKSSPVGADQGHNYFFWVGPRMSMSVGQPSRMKNTNRGTSIRLRSTSARQDIERRTPKKRGADIPVCGFWRLSSRQFRNTGLESPVNPQAGKPALHPAADGDAWPTLDPPPAVADRALHSLTKLKLFPTVSVLNLESNY
jgi:hypothetical protein